MKGRDRIGEKLAEHGIGIVGFRCPTDLLVTFQRECCAERTREQALLNLVTDAVRNPREMVVEDSATGGDDVYVTFRCPPNLVESFDRLYCKRKKRPDALISIIAEETKRLTTTDAIC